MLAGGRISRIALTLAVVGLLAPLAANAAVETEGIVAAPAVSTTPAQAAEAPALAFLTESSCWTISCVSDDQCTRLCGAVAICVLQIPGGNKRCLEVNF